MPLENDIESFRQWATKLGCPPEAMPSEEALKSIFKSRQREIFCNMMHRVRPRQEVQDIRENILIRKMEKLKDQVVPACSRSYLPKEMQTYLKMKDLEKKKQDSEMRLEEEKREYDVLANVIKTKNMQCISLTHKREMLQAKVNVLEFKAQSLDKQIAKQEQQKQQILATMPVQLTSKNANEAAAIEAVKKALQELETFYNLYINNDSPQSRQEARKELWSKIRAIFGNVPNFLLFNAVMRLKDEQLQDVMSLNKTNIEKSLSFNGSNSKESMSKFELKLMKTKADLVGLVAKYLTARNERLVLEERFSNAYSSFADALQKKVNLFHGGVEESVEDIISDYLVQYNLRNFSKSQNEFLSQQIEEFKADIGCRAKHLKNHEVLLGSIKEVYGNINTSINRIQYEMQQLGQIKEKILYSRDMMKHLFEAGNAAASNKSNFLPTKLKLNNNTLTLSGDSFDLGGGGAGDNVFCSTKLDFDATLLSLNNTTMRRSFGSNDGTLMPAANTNAEGRLTLPPHTSELLAFAELPLEKFSCVSKQCSFYFAANPLIVESRELSSTMQLAPGILLTPFGAVQEVRNRIAWAELIAKFSNDLKLDLDTVVVDPELFKAKLKEQRERIEELLDKIDVTAINTNHILQKVAKLYDFVLKNPLRHYIPATKTYNNQTYAAYEAEFNIYFRIVDTSIKS